MPLFSHHKHSFCRIVREHTVRKSEREAQARFTTVWMGRYIYLYYTGRLGRNPYDNTHARGDAVYIYIICMCVCVYYHNRMLYFIIHNINTMYLVYHCTSIQVELSLRLWTRLDFTSIYLFRERAMRAGTLTAAHTCMP